MDLILTKCGMDAGNMLIFGPEFAHIFSVQHIVRSAENCEVICNSPDVGWG